MSFFTAMLDVGTLIGGPILGLIIDTAGWEPMYVTAGVALGVATVIFARWDRRVMNEDARSTEPAQ
jgi:predicted MFS family arabinose efflux permease